MQLVPIVASVKQTLRSPIETRLENEVKLAKWDEQSYYALADSSKKSHQKLMMLIREYEEVLEKNVVAILEESFIDGVRSSSESTALASAAHEAKGIG